MSVNHGTTRYAELMLESLVRHHPDRSSMRLLVLDNDSPDVERLQRFAADGITVQQSGYTTTAAVTTHGEILRDAVLADSDCDAYCFVDCDVCFCRDDTVDMLAAELDAGPDLFGVQASWLKPDGSALAEAESPRRPRSEISERVRPLPDGAWSEPTSYAVELQLDDRIHPFCAVIENSPEFRSVVENLGLSPAAVQCERGGKWWDTLGLLTQVMKTHRRTWRRSDVGVIHFGNVSWDPQWAAEKAADRERLMRQYTRHSSR